MAALQVLEDQFKDQGFRVLGMFSNDFNQAGSGDDIDSCTAEHAVAFQQFAIDHVTGANVRPVFEWLLGQPNPGPASQIAPTWNFHKYLISRTGEFVGTWTRPVWPGDDPNDPNDSFESSVIVQAIEAELAK